MNQYDFIKLFSSLLLESDNPYFKKSDLEKFLSEHYNDPQYKKLFSSFDIITNDDNSKTIDLNFPILILARSEFLTIADLLDLTLIANYSIEETKELVNQESLNYLLEINSLLDKYLTIDFNHSKSK